LLPSTINVRDQIAIKYRARAQLRRSSAARVDFGVALTVERQDVVGFNVPVAALHSGRADRHSGNGDADDLGTLLEQSPDDVRRYVALDDLAVDESGMARRAFEESRPPDMGEVIAASTA